MEKSSEQPTAKLGGETPSVVTEIGESGKSSETVGETDISVQTPYSDGEYESLSDTLDYLHNNVEGIKEDLLRVAKAV